MPKQIPQDWKSLWVTDVLSRHQWGRCSGMDILRIQKVGHSPKIYAVWMPRKDDDPRSNAGRSSSGKRLPIKISTGQVDPKPAASAALDIYNQWEENNQETVVQIEEDKEYSLSVFWESWFSRESDKRRSFPNFAKWCRDTRLKWNGDGYGIVHQPWSKKRIDQITPLDFKDYWAVLDARRTDKNNMSGTKSQQKTLIKKLMELGRDSVKDFNKMTIPVFPKIHNSGNKSVTSLTKEQWEQLRLTLIDLTGGNARRPMSPTAYWKLQWTQANRCNIRNWIDLWDAIHLQWFFYLRAEDMPRLKHEWFREVSTGEQKVFACSLEKIKTDRDQITTRPYRPDHYDFIRILLKRRRHGDYLVLPYMSRSGGEEGKPVLANLNFLLKEAAKATNKKFKSHLPENLTWTTLRHTAFRLTLEDDDGLSKMDELINFARNGHTSVPMLQDHYLNQINLERATKRAMQVIPKGKLDGVLSAMSIKDSPVERQAILDNLIFNLELDVDQTEVTKAFPEDDGDVDEPVEGSP